MEHTPGPVKLAASGRRDDALSRSRRITTRVGVGALALVGGLTIYLSHALPGHHAAASDTSGPSSTQPSSTQPSSTQPSSTGTSVPATTIAPPNTAPVHVQRPAHISSGAS